MSFPFGKKSFSNKPTELTHPPYIQIHWQFSAFFIAKFVGPYTYKCCMGQCIAKIVFAQLETLFHRTCIIFPKKKVCSLKRPR